GSKETRPLLPTTTPSSSSNSIKEIIAIHKERPAAQATDSAVVVAVATQPIADKPGPLATRKETGFDHSVDQLGQAPWAKEETAAELPGKSTLATDEKKEVSVA